MLIDWFTVGAQVLNFVILVALLKRFLYKPVLDAIDAREARIARQVADAQAAKASAASERDELARRQAEFETSRDALLKKAAQDAEAEGKRLLDAARAAADAAGARRRDAEREAAQRLQRSLAGAIRDEAFALARATLADVADASLDERIAGVLLQRIAALDAATRQALAAGLDARAPCAVVRSAFEIAPASRDALREAVVRLLGPVEVRFETAPELVAGVELVAGGQKIAWNADHRLESLAQWVDGASGAAT